MSVGDGNVIRDMICRGNFVLIGAGQLGDMAISLWPEAVPLPRLILDSQRTGLCRGVKISNLIGHKGNSDSVYLLSAFKLKSSEVDSIFSRLGQGVILTVYDFFEEYCPLTFSNGWRCLDPDDIKLRSLEAVRRNFSDVRSLAVFDAAVYWRYYRKLFPDFDCEPESTKYDLRRFPVIIKDYEFVFDCGAFDMALVSFLSAAGVKIGCYIAFEPDNQSFEQCRHRAGALKEALPSKVRLENVALSDVIEDRLFLSNGLLSARLVPSHYAEGNTVPTVTQTTTLDRFVSNLAGIGSGRVLLKLHVEGAELAVLRGAERFIRASKPDIFVNLSHDEESLLKIPEFIKSIGGYSMFLAGHSLFGEGVTLFATQHPKGGRIA
jgi:FkbM family methyltransferase